jgi:hypothetical protein
MRIGGWLFADNQYRHFKDNGRFFMGLKALDHQAVLLFAGTSPADDS